MTVHKMTGLYTDFFSAYLKKKTQNFEPSPYLKALSNKNVQIKLIGISMILHCTKLQLSLRSGSWVASINCNINFKVLPPPALVLLVFHKNDHTKSCFVFEDLSEILISLSQSSFASVSEVVISSTKEWLKLRD
jgi:hypothetical protein